jgi:hypothetical protein
LKPKHKNLLSNLKAKIETSVGVQASMPLPSGTANRRSAGVAKTDLADIFIYFILLVHFVIPQKQ